MSHLVQTTGSAILLKELGQDLGLPLVFDEYGQCLLILDNKLLISIHTVDDSWVLYGMLGTYNHPDQAFFQYLFSLNQILAEQGHGALAFDKHNSAILYIQHIPLQDANRTTVYHALEAFTDWLEALIQRLAENEINITSITTPPFQPDPLVRRRLS